ncbi:N-acetyl-gamma-glutamyl-phosphate reductase [Opitutus terrae]|uniref:N-acetyl-gamma-glutamyl-phosphate reductase n=1 Tax=Opitutus terrae (strain DSM 11246 / JCM 15787 / PB90-1) TaxID=452637 RepID=B1ZUE1_OPITP|nr:N-acetyl-gamma-glutamyl-phosphate reductase [Opitutus terrae]ACB73984.1 N-acetyl-gamma-glutamyl-phosphate reductase [Opitutus terrae PB90-1]
MKVGIVGASGYSGEVLVKILLGHPNVTLAAVTSRSNAGKPLAAVIPAVRGIDRGLKFTDSDAAALAASDIDLFFLALPHGAAATYAKALVPAGKRVIDLSADFRIANLATYQKYYGEHHAPELLPGARFVLPELTPPSWKKEAKLIAAPGCYPTSILLPLIPLLKAGLVTREHIVVNAYSGVSGAGKKVDEAYLYAERAESSKAYGLVKHRHLAEVEEQLELYSGAKTVIQFNPHLAPMRRGIATTTTVPAAAGANIDKLYAAWRETYAKAPFVQILPSGETPDTAYTIGTNRIDMSAVHDPRTNNFVITSAEDNLVKGASGQAVQIMNLWCGFEETAGLV